MLKREELLKLMKATANADRNASTAYSWNGEAFSYTELNDTLREELKAYAGTYALFRENKNIIYALMEETFDDVLPKRVMELYGQFAEIKQFPQGKKPIFTQRITTAALRRAKQFIGKVGLAGRYEVFKLDGASYEVTTNAIGGAAQIAFEEFLDGRVNFADVLDVVMMGLDECIYVEIEKQLIGATATIQPANKSVQSTFNEAEMDNLLSIADSYGSLGVIYCTYDFAAQMMPADKWFSDAMKDTRWNTGYFTMYKGHRVVILPQSYEDETNTVKVIDPSYAWIIPAGTNDKPVKIAFEGGTIVEDYKNRGDRSMEVQVYKKVGVAAIFTPNICVYQNTSLKRTRD